MQHQRSSLFGKQGMLVFSLFLCVVCKVLAQPAPEKQSIASVFLADFASAPEAERIITAALRIPPDRRIPFISGYFLGRKYHPETKKRIKTQRASSRTKQEATNDRPLPVEKLVTSLTVLDCMTYVEHVLALSTAERADYTGAFLPRLVDIMFDADGKPLQNNLRNHFTSRWGDVNERKGYLTNIARNHPMATSRSVVLNKVGSNRTYYVEDRFMIASGPQTVWYFPTQTILDRKIELESGDILALVCDKEGLDVTHMAFFIEQKGKRIFRHASYTLNKIVDQDFEAYLKEKKELTGVMVFRPRWGAPPPPFYRFVTP
ncbi:MAG: N-acetylmuramoyl-L-alanine amidase-like domain-containing protein [Candidatus Ozemobacteraceae bacterium]